MNLANNSVLYDAQKVVDRLAHVLSREFPSVKGFSARNLKYMKALADIWADSQFVLQPVAQLPWGHIRTILDKTRTTSSCGAIVRR